MGWSIKKPLGNVGSSVSHAVSSAANSVGNAVATNVNHAVEGVQHIVNNPAKIVTDPLNITGKAISDTSTTAQDVGHDTTKAVGKGASDTVHGGGVAIYDTAKVAGNYVSIIGRAMLAVPTFVDKNLLNNNFDKYTGGLLTTSNNVMDTPKELFSGGRVDDNLKDTVRLGMIAAAIYLSGGTAIVAGEEVVVLGGASAVAGYSATQATAGMSGKSWGQVLSDVSNTYLPGPVGGMVGNIFNPPPKQSVEYNSTYTPTSAADLFQYENVGNLIPVVVAGAGAVIALLLIMKLKKKI